MRRLSAPSFLLSLVSFAALSFAWTPAADDAQWARHAFDHRCADVRLANAATAVRCAADGSVGAVEAPVDFGLARQFEAQIRWTWTPAAQMARAPAARAGTAVFVAGDFVVVERTTCPGCRRVMGRSWAFRPASVPEATLRAVQQAAGLPPSPLLRTVRAWEDARPATGSTAVASRIESP